MKKALTSWDMKKYIIISTIRSLLVLACVTTLFSCGGGKALGIMARADELMWTEPDSALAILETIDTASLRTKSQRAKYSLLYTMALDRNHKLIPGLSVIEPAARFYERHGSKDDKMKMYFYLGVSYDDAGDHGSAITNYLRAKAYSSESDNLVFKGLVLFAISDIYRRNNNYSESLRYAENALDSFTAASDSLRIWNTTGIIASLYMDISDYEKADIWYSDFFEFPCRDSSMYSRVLMNQALSYLWRDVPEPGRSVELFVKAVNDFNGSPTPRDYCAYAFALELLGDSETADSVISQLEAQGCPSDVLDVWRYRFCRNRGEYKEALGLLEQSVKNRDEEVFATVNQSVALVQSDYYEAKSLSLEKDIKIQRLGKWVSVLSCLLLAAAFAEILSILMRKWKRQMEEMAVINDEVSQRLRETLSLKEEHERSLETLALENEMASKKIEELSRELSSSNDGRLVSALRNKYVRAYKSQYQQLNDLCRQYWEASRLSKGGKDKIYSEVKRIVAVLDEQNESRLEAMIDEGLDGIMTKLRAAMPGTSERDFRFIAFIILGFDAKTIARVMNYNVSSVYTKRSNIKERLLSLEFDGKDILLALLS